MNEDHNILYIVNIVAACVVFVIAMVFNALAGASPEGLKVFLNNTGAVSRFYYTDITPAGWTFSIWGVIYTWLALFLVYSLSTIFRRSTYGYLYITPGHQPSAVYLFFTINMLCNIGWLLLWDRFLPEYALILIVLQPVLSSGAFFVSVKALYTHALELKQERMTRDIWLTRFITHNALGLYVTWVTISMVINIDVVIIYKAGWEVTLGGTVSLALIFFDFTTWFFLDNFLTDKFTRYAFTPYLTYIVVISSSLSQNWDPSENNSVLSAFLLAEVVLGTILKFTIMIWRYFKVPIYHPEEEAMFLESSSNRDYGSV